MSDRNELEIGSLAPDFTLPTAGNLPVTLSSFQNQQNVVLFFMREFV